MRFVFLYHTLVSDWNHGNAHFLRGIASELISRGHEVRVLEPRDSWSVANLLNGHGVAAIRAFHEAYPLLRPRRYRLENLDLDAVLDGADVVLVHEWSNHDLVRRIGEHRARVGRYALFFHDTHHRMITDPEAMAAYHLENYDGVLAYGRVLQEMYERSGRVAKAWTWHEAADVRVFKPLPAPERTADLIWIGNWGDDERAAELEEFLFSPAKALRLSGTVYGVRYPTQALAKLRDAGLAYGHWLPNFMAPEAFSVHRFTVHVPRRPYVAALPGIPTIRPFEAMACGIPLISAPWSDVENLFRPGVDYLVARTGAEMQRSMRAVIQDPSLAGELAANGRETILTRHTCAHRVNELMAVVSQTLGNGRVTAARGGSSSSEAGLDPIVVQARFTP